MKFVISSADLLRHLHAIKKVLDSVGYPSLFDNCFPQSRRNNVSPSIVFNFNGLYNDSNFLQRILKSNNREFRVSKYEKKKDNFYTKYKSNFRSPDRFPIVESTVMPIVKPIQKLRLDFSPYLTGSINQLIRQMAICIKHIQSNLFSVLRNTRIHTLSIFFGLCCSRSGYIFEALAGTSSHPIPVK